MARRCVWPYHAGARAARMTANTACTARGEPGGNADRLKHGVCRVASPPPRDSGAQYSPAPRGGKKKQESTRLLVLYPPL
jgi:hypothetical protein